jgi:carboxymethylenebutenolidase
MAGLPSAKLVVLAPNASLQPPLSRRGHGPGLIIVSPGFATSASAATLDPAPQKKWAEEGYAVVQLVFGKEGAAKEGDWEVSSALEKAVDALVNLDDCDVKDRFALIGRWLPLSRRRNE